MTRNLHIFRCNCIFCKERTIICKQYEGMKKVGKCTKTVHFGQNSTIRCSKYSSFYKIPTSLFFFSYNINSSFFSHYYYYRKNIKENQKENMNNYTQK